MVAITNILITALSLVAVAVAGDMYLYDCANCKCDAKSQRTGFSGDTGCISNFGGAIAAGLTRSGSRATTCSYFSDSACSQQFQSAGVNGGQTWGCTAANQRIQSIRCYYNV
ncbi:hypothetical protein BZA05DRAFT_416670 [Tricharina praecox]|uniref:uncharacterized protein n=1 Tax=Tricharina praecox TaxID=43433 RepID=UPI00221EEF0C|nr:uncharacterized protein BZA05DRAFT_416670 [Tricharina praecox]KAI5856060.1 hypothetical protein BZA05DRAFT_416670 [Tricharina praecox]